MKTATITPTTTKKNATVKKDSAPKKGTNDTKVQSAKKEISNILKPNAKSRISKLETLNILAEKHQKVSDKYDELTNFIASSDGTNGMMKFSAENSYTFNVTSPAVVSKILLVVEKELAEALQKAENEVLSFNI